MANKLHIYMNNPTSRMKDGTEASTDTETSPIAVLLDAAKEEEKAVKCAVRCDSGYKVEGAVTIKFVGTNAAKWKAAQDNNYTVDTVLASADWKDTISLQSVGEGNVIFQAMGDGNHSLATAKTNWENIKKTLSPEEAAVHPARYALCEIENIHDEGIVFEPIHRVIFAKNGQSGEELVKEAVELLNEQNEKAYIAPEGTAAPEGGFAIPCLAGEQRGTIVVEGPSAQLEVGVLQNALDVMVKERKSVDIDYIHGTKALESLSAEAGNAGFALPAMDKFMLFPAVAADGALPRKTFSMGEANEKRYYIESRYIGK